MASYVRFYRLVRIFLKRQLFFVALYFLLCFPGFLCIWPVYFGAFSVSALIHLFCLPIKIYKLKTHWISGSWRTRAPIICFLICSKALIVAFLHVRAYPSCNHNRCHNCAESLKPWTKALGCFLLRVCSSFAVPPSVHLHWFGSDLVLEQEIASVVAMVDIHISSSLSPKFDANQLCCSKFDAVGGVDCWIPGFAHVGLRGLL